MQASEEGSESESESEDEEGGAQIVDEEASRGCAAQLAPGREGQDAVAHSAGSSAAAADAAHLKPPCCLPPSSQLARAVCQP